MRRPLELSEQLGDLPREVLHETEYRYPASSSVVTKRTVQRRGNFSPAIPIITADGKKAVLPFNRLRAYLIVFNVDTVNALWANVGVPAAVNGCIRIPPGGNWEPWVAPINDIYLVGDVASQSAIVMEGSQW